MEQVIKQIRPVNEDVGRLVKEYQAKLTKPQGSLGRLEALSIQLAEITGEAFPNVSPPASLVFAADHGIAREGVSAYPQEVTAQMVKNFLNEGAAINVLARQVSAQVEIVDIGVASDLDDCRMINKKVRYGTGNFLRENAMSRAEAVKAIEVGMEVAEDVINNGAKTLIIGEMGIANTTSSSAILALLSGVDVNKITGKGTGITREIHQHKQAVIRQTLASRTPDRKDAIDILSKIGGLEIAGMTGAMLMGASRQVPILVDGFICTVSALLAVMLAPELRNYLIFSHHSEEPGHQTALDLLDAKPLLDLGLKLGEGTGSALAFPLLESSVNILKEMATFETANVDTMTSNDLQTKK